MPSTLLIADLCRFTQDDELLESVALSALPKNYKGDTDKELRRSIQDARRKGLDKRPVEKAADPEALARKVLSHTLLFHDDNQDAYMSVRTGGGGSLTYRLPGRHATLFIRKVEHDNGGEKVMSATRINDISQMLQAKAIHGSPPRIVYQRLARIDDRTVIIDRGDPTGEVIIIAPGGWNIHSASPVHYTRGDGTRSLPRPERRCVRGALRKLKRLLQLDDDNWALFIGAVFSMLRGRAPYICVLVEGPQGSGKTVLCKIIKLMIDPNVQLLPRLPSAENDIMVVAKAYFLVGFDNVSGIRFDVSDCLCSILTDGGFSKRKLYFDDDLAAIRVSRPIMINGIGEYATRPDLLDRAVIIQLPRRREHTSEKEVMEQFHAMLPEVLAELYDAVAVALANEDDTILPVNVRMVDAARWVTAAEPLLGIEQGAFATNMARRQEETAVEQVNHDPMVIALKQLLRDQPFLGLMHELFIHVSGGDHPVRGQPLNPSQLSKSLKRLAPSLERSGVHMRMEEKTRDGRLIRIWRDDQDPESAVRHREPDW